MVYLPENYYHVYNRGNDKRQIFLEAENYRFFLRRLKEYLAKGSTQLAAYCLMPNHYHLLVYLEKRVDFSNVLRRFTTSYVRSFNNRYGRIGYLYQGNTKAKLVDDEKHLIDLCRYIHLNPVTAGLVQTPEMWEYSDYREWISDDLPATSCIAKTRAAYFPSAGDYRVFVEGYVAEARGRGEDERRMFESED